MRSGINVVSISIEYPNPSEPGKGLFIRARLQALAKIFSLTVLSPLALLDYANPKNRLLASRHIPSRSRDGAIEVSYPRWLYPPRGGFLNAFCLFFRILWPLHRLRRLSRLDILDAHFVHPDGVATALAAWVLRKPFIVTVRGNELQHQQFRFRKRCMAWALRRAARVIAVSDNLADCAVAMGADPKNVRVIPNGIDTELFFPRDRIRCRTTHRISPGARVILSVGDLAEIKGHHRVIRALEGLRQSGIDAELIIAGGNGRSGQYAAVLRREVADRGLQNQVRFVGAIGQQRLAELMSAADVLCLASSREGCPNVVIEALACGTPVVATDVGAVRRLIPTEQYGRVVSLNEPEALQQALGDSLCRTWARTSIAVWGASRTWPQVADEVAGVIRDAAGETSQGKRPRAIIVNADDLGKGTEVNDAIFELMAGNRVDSATIMANGPAFDHAIRGLRQLRDCSVGIHLNVTEFAPLSSGPQARLLTDPDGLLHLGILHATPNPRLLRAIYSEFCSQVDHLLASGVCISHIDSHHHVHTVPFMFPVVKAIQHRYGIRKIRISKNIYTDQTPCSPSLRAKKRLYNWALRADSETTEGFTELSSFCEAARSRDIPQRTIELMVHPGAREAQQETALLSSPWEETLPFLIQRFNYKQFSRKVRAQG